MNDNGNLLVIGIVLAVVLAAGFYLLQPALTGKATTTQTESIGGERTPPAQNTPAREVAVVQPTNAVGSRMLSLFSPTQETSPSNASGTLKIVVNQALISHPNVLDLVITPAIKSTEEKEAPFNAVKEALGIA